MLGRRPREPPFIWVACGGADRLVPTMSAFASGQHTTLPISITCFSGSFSSVAFALRLISASIFLVATIVGAAVWLALAEAQSELFPPLWAALRLAPVETHSVPVDWLPLTALAAAQTFIAILIAFSLRQVIVGMGVDRFIDRALGHNQTSDESQFHWGLYRAVVLTVLTVNVGVWRFYPGGGLSLVAMLIAAVVLMVPPMRLVTWWWRRRGADPTIPSPDNALSEDWIIECDKARNRVVIKDGSMKITVWVTATLAFTMLGWVGIALLWHASSTHVMTLTAVALAALALFLLALYWLSKCFVVWVEHDKLQWGWRSLLQVRRLGWLPLAKVPELQRAPDPLGDSGRNPHCRWRLQVNTSTARPVAITPWLRDDVARAVEQAIHQLRM